MKFDRIDSYFWADFSFLTRPDKNSNPKLHFRTRLNGKWGFVDNTGKEIIPPRYDEVSAVYGESDRVAIFNIGGKYDRNDDELIGGKWGLVDISGKELIPPRYDELENFHDGLALVKLNGKYGFIDIRGKVVIPTIYDSLGIFFFPMKAPLNSKSTASGD